MNPATIAVVFYLSGATSAPLQQAGGFGSGSWGTPPKREPSQDWPFQNNADYGKPLRNPWAKAFQPAVINIRPEVLQPQQPQQMKVPMVAQGASTRAGGSSSDQPPMKVVHFPASAHSQVQAQPNTVAANTAATTPTTDTTPPAMDPPPAMAPLAPAAVANPPAPASVANPADTSVANPADASALNPTAATLAATNAGAAANAALESIKSTTASSAPPIVATADEASTTSAAAATAGHAAARSAAIAAANVAVATTPITNTAPDQASATSQNASNTEPNSGGASGGNTDGNADVANHVAAQLASSIGQQREDDEEEDGESEQQTRQIDGPSIHALPQPTTGKRSCRPLVLVHGLGQNSTRVKIVANFILKVCPNTYIARPDTGDGNLGSSISTPMSRQLQTLTNFIQNDPNLRVAGGFNLYGYSQGGVLARAYVETSNDPPVHNLITLGSPHNGVNHLAGKRKSFYEHLPTAFSPKYKKEETGWQKMFKEGIAQLDVLQSVAMYSDTVQAQYAFAGYWKDPERPEKYLTHCKFLPDINNEKTEKNEQYRERMSSLNMFVLAAWSNELILIPSATAQFGYYKGNNTGEIVKMKETAQYQQDWIGLRTLDEAGKLKVVQVPGDHWSGLEFTWKFDKRSNEGKFNQYLMEYFLD